MKNIAISIIALMCFACSEEITPIMPLDSQKVTISSNDYTTVTVKIYNDNFERVVIHYPNDVRFTNVYLPKGEYKYSSNCGSGVIDSNTIILQCH